MDDEISSRFSCPICCEVLKQPVAINGCSHRFCYECLLKTPKAPSGAVPCPVCRVQFRLDKDISPDRPLEREINSTFTQCRACRQQLSLLHFNHHSVTCSKRRKPVHQFTPVALTTQKVIVPPNRSLFKCPLCTKSGIDCKGLVEHVNQFHANSTTAVVCPVCSSMPWGSPDQQSQNFIQHLNLRHRFEYDTYVDYEQDDDTALKAALEASR